MAKILIIDDEPPIRKLLSTLLEQSEHHTLEAGNGNEGLDMYKAHLPDLVLTDLIMPEKEGIELIKEIKELNPDANIIAMSGGGRIGPEIYLNLAKRLGAVHILSKPFSNQELLAAVNDALYSSD